MSARKGGKTARPARRAHRTTPVISGKLASRHHDTTAAHPTEARMRELAKTEWGVAYERGRITACESEQAARQLQAATGGELVYRRTWVTTWSQGSPLLAREAPPRARAAIPGSA